MVIFFFLKLLAFPCGKFSQATESDKKLSFRRTLSSAANNKRRTHVGAPFEIHC
jgi:hypothetical protein